MRRCRSAAVFVGIIFAMAGLVPNGALAAASVKPPTSPGGANLHALTPAKVLDTQQGLGGITGQIQPGTVYTFKVTGLGGVPSKAVSAVALSVTATSPSGPGELRIFQSGSTAPPQAAVGFGSGSSSDLVVSKINSAGQLAITTTAATFVKADVLAWYDKFTFLSYNPTAGLPFSGVPQQALVDTKTGLGGFIGKVAAGQYLNVQMSGQAGLPSSSVSAVVLSTIVSGATGAGSIAVYPAGIADPGTTSLSYGLGAPVSVAAISAVSSAGAITVHNRAAAAYVRIEVTGYYSSDPNRIVTGESSIVKPTVLVDTAKGIGNPSQLTSGQTLKVAVQGRGQVPSIGAAAVVLAVKASGATKAGRLTLYPDDESRPNATTLAYRSGTEAVGEVISRLGFATGALDVYNAGGSVDVAIYVLEWNPFVIPPPPSSQSHVSTPPKLDVSIARNQLQGEALLQYWNDRRLASARPYATPAHKTGGGSPLAPPLNPPRYPVQDSGLLAQSSYVPQVGRLYFTSPNGDASLCSGTVVARNEVITAGHCVVDSTGQSTNFVFAPGQVGTSRPFGLWSSNFATYYRYFQEHFLYGPLDYAIVVFNDQQNGQFIGDVTGQFQLLYNSPGGDKFVEGYPCEGYFSNPTICSGFDSNTALAYVWYCHSPVGGYDQDPTTDNVPKWQVGFGCYTNGGASGGPIFEFWNGAWYVSSVTSTVSDCVLQDGSPDPNTCASGQGRWFSYDEWGSYFDDVWTANLYNLHRI